MSEPHVLVAKDKVQRYLSSLISFNVTEDGKYTFRHGSTRFFIYVDDFGDEDTMVSIDVPLLMKVQPTAELYRYVATSGYKFGRLRVLENDTGEALVLFDHNLLGTYLDPEELKMTVALMAKTADELDDEMQKQFGGNKFHEDSAS